MLRVSVRYELPTEVLIRFTVGCGVMPFSLVEVRRCFRGCCCLCHDRRYL